LRSSEIAIDDLHRSVDAVRERLPLGAAGGTDAEGAALEELHTAVGLHLRVGEVVDGDLMPDHFDVGQVVPGGVVSEVGGALQEDRPRGQPQPELAFLVRVEGEVVRLRRVALEEPGERLAGVHDAEEARVVDELLVPVG
jgi:hypothetical protein